MTPGRGQGRNALAEVQESIRRAAEAGEMDRRRAPMLVALEGYHSVEPVQSRSRTSAAERSTM